TDDGAERAGREPGGGGSDAAHIHVQVFDLQRPIGAPQGPFDASTSHPSDPGLVDARSDGCCRRQETCRDRIHVIALDLADGEAARPIEEHAIEGHHTDASAQSAEPGKAVIGGPERNSAGLAEQLGREAEPDSTPFAGDLDVALDAPYPPIELIV